MSDAETAGLHGGPLAGIRVLELGSTIAGPFCGRLLADFGADVIKVEAAEGDTLRSMGKHVDGRSLYAASLLRNKSIISVDLRRSEGQDIVRTLIKACDVVVENFKPGSLEKWGLGYEDLARIKPGLVMVRISGYGQTGPYAQRSGFGVIGEALSGLRHVTGDPDRPPARVAVSLTDYITGLYAAFGAVMAIMVQRQTGLGQYVDTALYEAAFSFMEPHVPAYEKLGSIAGRAGSRLPDSVPNSLFETRDGGFIHIAAIGEPVYRRFATAIGRPDLVEDPRFRAPRDRAAHVEELEDIISAWTQARDLEEVEATLAAADVPASRIYTMADIFRDPHFAARGAIVDVPDAELGSVKMANVVPRLSATPGTIRSAGSGVIGADTRSVLARVGGYAEAEIDAFLARGVIADGLRERSASGPPR